jgi:hypothetical protein
MSHVLQKIVMYYQWLVFSSGGNRSRSKARGIAANLAMGAL